MSFETALWATTHLTAFTLALQALELLLMKRSTDVGRIWRAVILRRELRAGLPVPGAIADALASEKSLTVLAVTQLTAALFALIFPGVGFALAFFTHFAICLRFRGSLNGGSDMMTVVVLTGLLIAWWTPSPDFARLGLLYIAVQLLLSYVKAGLSKIRHIEWRRGRALAIFLERSFHADIRSFGRRLERHPLVGAGLAWGIMLFEIGAVTVPFFPALPGAYFLAALGFHFAIYLTFGLNRFFWIWLCAWPSVFFLSALI